MVDADRQRTDGRRLDGYTISSSCEPNGSGVANNEKNEKKGYSYNLIMLKNTPYHIYEPRYEKTGHRGFQPGPTLTGLYIHKRWLEA